MLSFRFFLAYQLGSMLLATWYNQGFSANSFLLESNTLNRKSLSFRRPSNLSTVTTPRCVNNRLENRSSSFRRHATTKDNETPNAKSEPVQAFVQELEDAFRKNTFVSLTLRGVKKNKKKNGNADDLRGSIRQVQGRLIKVSSKKKKKKGNANDNQTIMLQMTIKYHGATDICKNFELDAVPKAINDLFLGDPAEIASEWGVQAVRAKPIQSAQLTTTDQVWDLRLDGKTTLRKEKVKQDDGSANVAPIAESHDRTKQVPLSNRAEFFQKLGVTNADGKPKPRMKGKLRQCQKFVEIVGKIIDECQKNEKKKISVVDMGCGRAYLTFSLHAYLQEHYKSIATTGIDVRPKLVAEISGIARSLGSDFDSLNFEAGTIEEVVAQASSNQQVADDDTLSVLVALHACDTATDDALYSAIAKNTDIIVVAPCCHKQVRPQLNAHFTATRDVHPLSSMLKHSIYRERISETVTDSLRALLLEYAGYKTQVFEFIGGEHTSKNVMITAIKDHQKANQESILEQIVSLAELHGIGRQKLAQMMEVDLLPGDEKAALQQQLTVKRGKPSQLSKNRMPPMRSR